jgi:pre-mRNA-splicing helicase BRR2
MLSAMAQTANLVLNAEGRRREGGPSGEVESLTAKKDVKTLLKNMGSRVSFSKPEETAEVKKKRKDREDKDSADDHGRRSRKSDSQSVLQTEVDVLYRPKTRETKLAYEVLLNFIQEEMGGQPHDVLRSAADEVLAVLKDDLLKDFERKKMIEELFGRGSKAVMESSRFASLFNIGKNITDYKAEGASGGDAMDDQLGVPVVFDEEDDDAQDDDDELDDDADVRPYFLLPVAWACVYVRVWMWMC